MERFTLSRDAPKFFEREKLVDSATSRCAYYLSIDPKTGECYLENALSIMDDDDWTDPMRSSWIGPLEQLLRAIGNAKPSETVGLYKGTTELTLEGGRYGYRDNRIPSEWIPEIRQLLPPPRPAR